MVTRLAELLRARDTLNKLIGEELKAERERAGLTQRELASTMGISSAYVSRIENAVKTPRPSTVGNFYHAITGKELPYGNLSTEGRAQKDVRKARGD